MRPEKSFDTQGLLIRSIISLLSVCGDSWPHVREMERVTLLDPILEDEPPFYLDGDGERHYNVVLGDQIDVPTASRQSGGGAGSVAAGAKLWVALLLLRRNAGDRQGVL
jgi:hypothetical protein